MIEERIEVKGVVFVLVAMGVALCTFMETLDLSIANVAIPYIAGDMGVTSSNGTWVVTCYMVGKAVVLPMSGWLAHKFGNTKLIMVCAALFGVVSFLCSMAPTFAFLLLWRFLQGVVAAPLTPLSQLLLIQIFPKEKKTAAMALWAMVLLLGPIFGPIIGGAITTDLTWRWIFLINVPVAIYASFTIFLFLRHWFTKMTDIKLDYIGLFLLALGVTCLQVFFDRGRQMDWLDSTHMRVLGSASIIFLTLFVLHQWKHENPLVDLRIFTIPSFVIGNAVLFISFMAINAALVITPLWLEDYMGYTALQAGVCLGAMGIVPLLAGPLIGKIMERGIYKQLAMIGIFIMGCVSLYFMTFNTNITYEKIALSRFYFGIGAAFYVAPLSNLPLVKVPPHLQTQAASMLQFFRVYVAGLGISWLTSIWNNRATFHHSMVGRSLTAFDDTLNYYKSIFRERFGYTVDRYYQILNDSLDVQAYMISMNEIMFICAMIFFFSLILLFFMPVTSEDCRNSQISAG